MHIIDVRLLYIVCRASMYDMRVLCIVCRASMHNIGALCILCRVFILDVRLLCIVCRVFILDVRALCVIGRTSMLVKIRCFCDKYVNVPAAKGDRSTWQVRNPDLPSRGFIGTLTCWYLQHRLGKSQHSTCQVAQRRTAVFSPTSPRV